jgi:GSH-dependent disulfide-bond oxidoreductase
MEARLAGRQWIMDDVYTIADISMLGWVRNLIGFYEARELVEFDSLQEVPAWLERGLARPAVQCGLTILRRPETSESSNFLDMRIRKCQLLRKSHCSARYLA